MDLKGIITAMVTPMDKQQKINYPATKQLVDYLIGSSVDGIFILGTNGEFHLLSNKEKLEFAEKVIEEVDGRVPVFVGTGGNGTEEVIKLSKEMEKIGADALSIITPYFITPSQSEVIRHYNKIAESVSLPILLYNIPGRTGMTLEPETVVELAKMDNIIGIKDSSGSFENIKKYIEITKDEKFSVLAGTDSLILKTLMAGGKGAIAATSNMIPDIVVAIYQNWLKGNMEEAQKAQEDLQPLRDTFKYGTLPSVLKKAVELYSNIPVGPPRFPAVEPTGKALEKVEEMVEFYKKQV
ncbi:4-hydroxy-tetrahydrodipicolinate synthase [Clostridium sp. WLY-B-L2]|uniref:4-hydroxy-tetrahydrodipicolinate synthase n=1 Tax=Clostridium aromativorans TaxID=2836848 RepID=A0ABS8N5P5_9CLOT|nr:4-hydroxy-tetrahydrodipicolinate synthase [Clostridium aromativorans]MCC9295095.1 4-hydroxy-tetrahydrodipicolinate synthase [Clostridium aromativorans]CAB1249418.1 4-hydroxy-tetrahydrodipicolinate synthase [Clostridiaceae bacterium BL-3]